MDKQTKEKISNRMSQVGIGEKLGVSSQAVGKWLRKGAFHQGALFLFARSLTGK